MKYKSISQKDFLIEEDVIACWTKAEDVPDSIKKTIFEQHRTHDYYTPLAKGKEWLFELTCRHQPRTGALLMQGGPLFVRVSRGSAVPYLFDMGLEMRGKVVLMKRSSFNNNPSDAGYQALLDQISAHISKRDGYPRKAEDRYRSLPPAIGAAYYNRFDGLNIPEDSVAGIYTRLLPYPIYRPWESFDGYLSACGRGYKKKYIPWLEERIPGMGPTKGLSSYINFMMFMYAPGEPGPRKGDAFFVKNNIQDGVIYHIKDADNENMRILSEPAEAIDRYCEHVLLEKEWRFDFLPYTSSM
ncbi:hypothetical protein J2X72_003053 [Phyllobacterium sp. 1468]|uniref:PA domain-containing protein n=1 Tax=Phyllobacterium sp. 1468 TaxID=2817759 RepID=UPI002856CBB5|nr:PA domain-containing protein [Phyllobacterium sp. 1468]MDR6634243.1 hypothetical protein [Phyllobacterium sp. 1468]